MPANYGILYEEVFGVSPQVAIYVAPNLTVKVTNRITGKPIENATVTINTTETVTDASGLAIFGELPAGTYKISVTKSGYKGWSKTVTFEVGQVMTVSLWPWWAIALGIVGGSAVGIIVIERLTRPKR